MSAEYQIACTFTDTCRGIDIAAHVFGAVRCDYRLAVFAFSDCFITGRQIDDYIGSMPGMSGRWGNRHPEVLAHLGGNYSAACFIMNQKIRCEGYRLSKQTDRIQHALLTV